MSRFPWLLLVAGCGSSDAGPTPDVTVELASITLGDDCGGSLPPPAKVGAEADQDSKRAPDGKRDSDALGDGYGCTQTSMQLVLKASGTAKPTTIKIKKVELLDPSRKGKVLEPLTAKLPRTWNGKQYVTWKESITASQTLQASYAISSPSWAKLTGGRRGASGKVFQVRVTVTVGTQDRTFEKQAVAAAIIDPEVDT